MTHLLTNLTAMNLTSGWHTLELHLFQRSQRPTYFMAPRSRAMSFVHHPRSCVGTQALNGSVVSKHWFEVVADWPTATNAARKCSDWVTYPCFQGTLASIGWMVSGKYNAMLASVRLGQ